MFSDLNTEQYIIIALSVVIVILWLIGRSRKKQIAHERATYEQSLRQKQQEWGRLTEEAISAQKRDAEQTIAAKQNELDNIKADASKYREEVAGNMEKSVPLGERLLIKAFCKLFQDTAFADFTIYHQLEFMDESNYGKESCKVDFFIVSPAGLFVIEHKMWKGVTYIFDDYCRNIFSDTFYKDKFRAESKNEENKSDASRYTVFNACESGDKNNEIILRYYNNPIAQARRYSGQLQKKLDPFGIKEVHNVVVFFASKTSYDVRYNNKPLPQAIGKYTTLLTDSGDNLKNFFLDRKQQSENSKEWGKNQTDNICKIFDAKNIVDYHLKIDSKTINQAPLNQLKIM